MKHMVILVGFCGRSEGVYENSHKSFGAFESSNNLHGKVIKHFLYETDRRKRKKRINEKFNLRSVLNFYIRNNIEFANGVGGPAPTRQ